MPPTSDEYSSLNAPAPDLPAPPPARDEGGRTATPSDRTRILAWNETAFHFSRPQLLHRLVEEQFARHPDATALIFENEWMSAAELNARANRLAHFLRQQGVGPDVLVCIAMQRSFEMVIALLAILKAGGAYVPVDPTYPQALTDYMFADAQAKCVLTQDRFADALGPNVAGLISLPRDAAQWQDLPAANPELINTPADAAYCIYTSGSTGRPKGAINSHAAICNRLLWIQRDLPMGPGDRFLQKTPFTFDVSVWEFFSPLIEGTPLVIARPEGHRDPVYLQRLIVEQQITVAHFVPSMLDAFMAFRGAAECASLRRVQCSGEALPAETQRRFFRTYPKAELHNLYGPTEAAVEVTWWACRRDDQRSFVPIGRPIANTQIYILDAAMNLVGVNEPGELHIGGANLARAYHRRPELTVERFVPHPFRPGERLYKTGDLARYLDDGSIQYLGRLDHQVKIGGVRIELEEVASVLREVPGVREAVVAAAKEQSGDTRLLAFLVGDDGHGLSSDTLREACERKMPAYQIPDAFHFMERFPLNANGKIDRAALPVREVQEQLNRPISAEHEPRNEPASRLESQLQEIWQELFARPKIGLDENFFDIGGRSLLAARLFATLEKRLNCQAPMAVLLTAPTIRRLAAELARATFGGRREPCVGIQLQGSRTPLFITHGIGGNVLNFYDLGARFAPDRPVYGIQSPGLAPQDDPPRTIESMAAQYLASVRKIQPSGPYLLAGWSYGGIVVFEMARQLLAAGEKVGLLAVLDALPPHIDVELSGGERLKRRALWLPRKIARDTSEFLAMTAGDKARHARDKARQAAGRVQGWFARQLMERSEESVAQLREGKDRAFYGLLARQYLPEPIDAEIVFVQAVDTVTRLIEPIEQWRRLSKKGARHFRIIADHNSMLMTPAVDTLADYVRSIID